MFSRLQFVFGLSLVGLAALTACGEKTEVRQAPKTAEDYFPIQIGARTVRMQVVALPDEMQRGLMFRKALGADDGMLFVFAQSQQMSFWMRNTTLALDIGYLDATGTLREIYPLYPLDERAVSSRGRDLQFALEMNQGWFQKNGVKPGDKLDLAALREALKARNLRPEVFGLR